MILLEVPFAEKDQAKALGARWNPVEKKWYVPEDKSENLSAFERWLPIHSGMDSADTPVPQQIILPNSVDATSSNEKEKGISLSQLMSQVQVAIRKQFSGAVWVMAEVANMNERRGHRYLELTETTSDGQQVASCRAMIWQSQANRLLTKFEEETGSELTLGQKVLLMVEPNFHEKFGFSLVIQDIDPSFTLGELEAALQAIRKQLIEEKLYDKNKAFPLPKDFYRVAVIAPPSAAGLGDFRADADLLVKSGLCEFKYFYSTFQGENVEKEMLMAFEAFLALHTTNHFDALIIIRGGGAKLDLQPLNNYALAAAIANMKLPVLTGIGHERDNTLLDEVCSQRFDTPSKVVGAIQRIIFNAAQTAKQNGLFIERASQLYIQKQKQQLQEMEARIQHKSLQSLHQHKQFLTPLILQIKQHSQEKLTTQKHLVEQQYDRISHQATSQIQLQRQQLSHLLERLQDRPQKLLDTSKASVQQLIAFILSAGPKTQLNRGFAIAKDKQSGQPITCKQQATKHTEFEVQFSDGSIEVQPIRNLQEDLF